MFDAAFAISVMEAGDTKAAARTLGLDFASLEIQQPEDIPTTFETLRTKVDAIYVVSDALIAPGLCRSWRTHVLRPKLRRPI